LLFGSENEKIISARARLYRAMHLKSSKADTYGNIHPADTFGPPPARKTQKVSTSPCQALIEHQYSLRSDVIALRYILHGTLVDALNADVANIPESCEG
jgi:hypothetical protein